MNEAPSTAVAPLVKDVPDSLGRGSPKVRRNLGQRARGVFDKLAALDQFELGATMTLVLLLLYVDSFWYLKIPITVVAVAGLIYRPLVCTSNFWFVLVIFLAASAWQNWYTIDNHKYLMLYWCLAISVSAAASGSPRETLRVNARWLIAFAFAFAALWKILSKDFLDGSFFYQDLLTENRFETLSKAIGGVPASALSAAADALHELKKIEHPALSVKLYDSSRLYLFAQVMTWWTVFIETAIAVTFLAPEKWRLSRLRDIFLLVFLLTTYTAATVVGFGWVLSIMGYVQARDDARWTKSLYLVSFALIIIYTGQWSDFFAHVTSFFSAGSATPSL
jgi:hypothetical protein